MTQIKFIPIDYDYFDFHDRTYVKIIGKADNGKRACIIDTCDIYFWAILHEGVPDKKIKYIQEQIEKIRVKKGSRESKVLKTELHEKNFLGKSVRAIKIFITNYKDANAIAEEIDYREIDKKRGYDLSFVTKYIMERKLIPLSWHDIDGEMLNNSAEFGGIDASLDLDICLKAEQIKLSESQPSFKPKVLAYDIETDDFEIGKGHILMISLVGDNFKKVLTWKHHSKKSNVETLKDEKEMLKKFTEYVKEYSPDILAGYFSDGFDLPYLRERAVKNRIRLNIGLDNSQPVFSRGAMLTGRIRGIVHLDILRFIRSNYSQYMQSETLSLNDVASELLGEKKIDFEFVHSSKINGDEWENYFEYNLHDSILTYKLTEKIWPDLMEFTKIVQEPLFDVSRNTMSAHVEDYIIHNLEKFNEIPEKRPFHEEIAKRKAREKYEGAFVLQPNPGLYEDLVFFDFTSYWPSIIVTYNLSKSTLLEKKEKNSTEVNLNKHKFYFTKKQGFFPAMLREVIKKRKQYKKEYNKDPNPFAKARSNAFKLLANASYGYQGFFGARYYCPEASASATGISRDLIKKTIDSLNKQGYTTIYSDTDSIALLRNKKSKSQVLQTLKEMNEKLPGIIELDLEDFYARGIWVTKRTGEFGAKKKYALINEKGKLKIRGFETIRRDWCNLARITQNKILELILEDGNEKKALEYVKNIIEKIKKREIPLKQLIIRTQLKKPVEEYRAEGPHVTIAKKMKERNIPVDIGMLIEYYIAETEGKKRALVRERARLPEEPGEYDIDYYLKNQILPAVENIFEIFGINIMDIIEAKKQKSLSDFK